VLAGLFGAAGTERGRWFFNIVPLLVFAYFVPTALSNTGVIPLQSELYDFVKHWLLPASLILFTMSVDIPAVLRLGPKQLTLFLAATATIVIGGPVAYYLLGGIVPESMGDQAWKGLAAMSGSWIGGGANFVAIGESVGATEETLGKIIVVDVALANIWMAILLFFAAREEQMDRWINADRTSLEELRRKSEAFQAEVARPVTLPDMLLMLFLAIGGTVLASTVAALCGTAHRAACSAPLRNSQRIRLEGAHRHRHRGRNLLHKASQPGRSRRQQDRIRVPLPAGRDHRRQSSNSPPCLKCRPCWQSPPCGSASMPFVLLLLRWGLRAPIFCMAVGSQANIGGAASAPVVAAAFHPALAPVGVLMGVLGYALGTAAGLVCARLLQMVHNLL
jgi:uncharacterized membrane protein